MNPEEGKVRVLIISPDGPAAEKAREVGERLLNQPRGTMLAKALSPTGGPPATHWLCENHFPRDVFDRMVAYPKTLGTEVIDGGTTHTADLLAQRGLKVIG